MRVLKTESAQSTKKEIRIGDIYCLSTGAKMSEHIGKLLECDRCGKSHFLYYDGPTKTLSTPNYVSDDYFSNRPKGWVKHQETGLLCDECEKAYQELLNEFFDR